MPDGKIESFRKGQAIHKPIGYVASYRSKVSHLVEGRVTVPEYVTFDVLLHIVGWDKRRPDYGKIDRNISRLHREWFPFWSRPMLIKQLNGLASKLYILDDGETIAIPNFAKYQSVSERKGVTPVTVEGPGGVTQVTVSVTPVTVGVTPVTESVTPVTPEGPQSSTTSESCEPKEQNNIKQQNKPPLSPAGGAKKGRRKSTEIDPVFVEALAAYPVREGGHSLPEAWSAFKARKAEGVSAEEMLAAVPRYLTFCEATGKIGTQFVMQPASFFGPKKRGWERDWTVTGSRKANDLLQRFDELMEATQ